jgi:hypothetical protein
MIWYLIALVAVLLLLWTFGGIFLVPDPVLNCLPSRWEVAKAYSHAIFMTVFFIKKLQLREVLNLVV